MPRFDHIKGEVSVRNLVWRQESNSALVEKWAQTAPLPQPYQVLDAKNKRFRISQGPHPRQLGMGWRKELRSEKEGCSEAAPRGILSLPSPSLTMPHQSGSPSQKWCSRFLQQ